LLIVSYIFSVFELPQLDQQSSVSTALQLQYNVRNPPRDSQPRGSQPVSQQHPYITNLEKSIIEMIPSNNGISAGMSS
jgi:hypothetical protein